MLRVIARLNVGGPALHVASLRELRPGALIANYHVTADA